MDEIVRRAIDAAGSPTALARAAGVKLPSIYCWTRIPPDRAIAISQALGIPRHELRPDLWDEPAKEPDVDGGNQASAA